MESSAVSVNKKSKVLSREQLESMNHQELINRITQLEAHNSQLKNVIHKKTHTDDSAESGECAGEHRRQKRKFDFSNSDMDKSPASSNNIVNDRMKRECLKNFIETYESLPELWNPSHPNYQNRAKRLAAVDKLVRVYGRLKPGANRADVRRKINTLRSNYRKDLKRAVTARDETGEGYQPTSWVFYAMQFLGNCEQSDSANMDFSETMFEDIPIDYHTNQSDYTEFHQMNESESFEKIDLPSVSSESSTAPQPQETKKPKHKSSSKRQKLLSLAYKYLENLEANDENSDLKLAKVWCEKLRSLDPRQKLLAEKAINDVLFEACLGNLHRGSVKINEEWQGRWVSTQFPSTMHGAGSSNPQLNIRNLSNGHLGM